MNIATLFNAMPGALAQGLIWAIMAIGVYLTFRILDVADLTVDGTLGLGGAVCIMCMTSGMNVWLSLLLAFGAGLLAVFLPFCKYLLKYLTFFFIVLKLCVFTIAYHPTMLHPSAVFFAVGRCRTERGFSA